MKGVSNVDVDVTTSWAASHGNFSSAWRRLRAGTKAEKADLEKKSIFKTCLNLAQIFHMHLFNTISTKKVRKRGYL